MNKEYLADYQNLVNRLEGRKGADNTDPAQDYQGFLNAATDLFVQKSTDYNDRYLVGLIELDARTIWAWEIDKKLDRLRTWLKRGELQVKGEGIRNSVDDLFIYTVQYVLYVNDVINHKVPDATFLSNLRENRRRRFGTQAAKLKPAEWVEFLVQKGRIKQDELLLQNLIRSYLGDQIRPEEWQLAIQKILNG